MRDGLYRAKAILGPMAALAKIKPPGRSYADWRRFLEECRAAGVSAILPGEPPQFATPVGYALLVRWRWLQKWENSGVPYQEAELAFQAQFERDEDAREKAAREHDTRRSRAMRERDTSKSKANPEADELFNYAEEMIPR